VSFFISSFFLSSFLFCLFVCFSFFLSFSFVFVCLFLFSLSVCLFHCFLLFSFFVPLFVWLFLLSLFLCFFSSFFVSLFVCFYLSIYLSSILPLFLACGAATHFLGVQITHNDAPQPVGLLWMNDQPDTEASTCQHATLTTDRHPCPRRDFNPQTQQTARPLEPEPLSLLFSHIKIVV